MCVPLLRAEVVKEACPAAVSDAVPSFFMPSLKVTEPVGVPPVEELTVPVKVTLWPNFAGFADEVKFVVVGFNCTTCVTAVDVLVEKFALPP